MVLVNDGSRDQSGVIIQGLAAQALFAIGVGRSPLRRPQPDESTLSNQASECGFAKVSCKSDARLNKKCTISEVDR
jgi:hypothetical protein